MKHIRIGTRGSKLALWQANWIRDRLEEILPDCSFEIIHIKTRGDKDLYTPLERIGGEGVFVKQIEFALLNGEIDVAVHSMKDLPTSLPDGLMIGAIPERADPADALISVHGLDLLHLPQGAIIGTGSIRRRAQLLHIRNDLIIRDIRGNVDTRLEKLKSGELDAIILAAAGVERLGQSELITQRLPYSISLPAVGQGAIGIEIRSQDRDMHNIVKSINHPESAAAVKAERAFLKRLSGGCRVPIAALSNIEHGELSLAGLVADRDGQKVIRSSISGRREEAENIGIRLAEILLDMEARSILETNR